MKNAALYVRVSTKEQLNGLSVDSQIAALTDFCKANGYAVYKIYNDAGISARKSYKKRPALLQMVEDCQKKRVDIILMTKLDRFFRSVADYYVVAEKIGNVPWRAIWEDYETESAAGVFKVNIMLAVSQSESDRTSERIKAVNAYRRTQGKYVGGKAPTGYTKQNSGLVKDEATKQGVQAFFEKYIRTFSLVEARAAAAANGANIKKATAIRMLKNTAYYGDASGYACEPYITREEFNLIQGQANNHTRQTTTEVHYIFSGLLICGKCGARMIAKYSSDKNAPASKRRYGYECGAHHNDRSACEGLQISQRKLEKAALERLQADYGNFSVEAELTDADNNTAEITALYGRLERVKLMFEDGDITAAEYREKRDMIKRDIDRLTTSVNRPSVRLDDEWIDLYGELDNVHKRSFWRSVVQSITLNADKTITISYK